MKQYHYELLIFILQCIRTLLVFVEDAFSLPVY